MGGPQPLSAPPEVFPAVEPGRRPRVLAEEVLVVLSLSLLASAVDALFSFLSAPVNRSVAVGLFRNVQLAQQISDIVFALAPAGLVVYLAGRWREPLSSFGLGTERLGRGLGWGAVVGLGVS